MSSILLRTIVISCLVAFVIGNEGDNLLTIRPEGTISPTPRDFRSGLGRVNGFKYCGGPGKVLDYRYESCSGEGTCQIPSDGIHYRCDFIFLPSENIPGGLGVRLNVTAPGIPPRSYDIPIRSSPIQAWKSYTAMTAGGPTEEFKGKTMTFRYIIYRLVDNSVEACAQAQFHNV